MCHSGVVPVSIAVTTWTLEMSGRPDPAPPALTAGELSVTRCEVPNPALNRFFYFGVGSDWLWTGRRPWTWKQWEETVVQPGYDTWIGYHRGSPAGYFELDATNPARVEVQYFGLLPAFIGHGLGGPLLTACIDHAWANPDTETVWLHTCSKDHPRALNNYLSRGFEIVRTDEDTEQLDDAPLEPWPGSARMPVTSAADHRGQASAFDATL